jgi:hypothetical protein
MADIFDLADVWNNGATTFTAIKMDVTDTTSASASLLFDMQVGSTSMFSIRKDGYTTANGVSTASVITPDNGELTLATDAITVTGSFHTVDTQGDASTDDLSTISGGVDGMIVVLQAENTARDVVVKDSVGNIQCAGDFTMDNTQDTITLLYSGALTTWVELSRSNNGA